MSRTRIVSWSDPAAAAAQAQTMSGLEALLAMIEGRISAPPIIELLGIKMLTAEPGRVTMGLQIGEHLYNPIGSVHGGVAATLLDSVMGCAVHSSLPIGRIYSTLEIKISYLRPMTQALGMITAEGNVISLGRKADFAEGRITGPDGKIYATGSTTCAVWDL
ncbi:MAG: PaaI family thioesterase [Acidocella sp.]|nr:PaaI family thioesterase [Acidocella sp.]